MLKEGLQLYQECYGESEMNKNWNSNEIIENIVVPVMKKSTSYLRKILDEGNLDMSSFLCFQGFCLLFKQYS